MQEMLCPQGIKMTLAPAPPLPQILIKIRWMVDISQCFRTSRHIKLLEELQTIGMADSVFCFFFLSIQRMKNAFAEIVWLSDYHCKGKQSSYLYLRRGILLRMTVWYRCICARAPKWFKDTESWNKRRLCIIYLNLHASMKLKLFHPC